MNPTDQQLADMSSLPRWEQEIIRKHAVHMSFHQAMYGPLGQPMVRVGDPSAEGDSE